MTVTVQVWLGVVEVAPLTVSVTVPVFFPVISKRATLGSSASAASSLIVTIPAALGSTVYRAKTLGVGVIFNTKESSSTRLLVVWLSSIFVGTITTTTGKTNLTASGPAELAKSPLMVIVTFVGMGSSDKSVLLMAIPFVHGFLAVNFHACSR